MLHFCWATYIWKIYQLTKIHNSSSWSVHKHKGEDGIEESGAVWNMVGFLRRCKWLQMTAVFLPIGCPLSVSAKQPSSTRLLPSFLLKRNCVCITSSSAWQPDSPSKIIAQYIVKPSSESSPVSSESSSSPWSPSPWSQWSGGTARLHCTITNVEQEAVSDTTLNIVIIIIIILHTSY